jgi:hypothetical protein
MKAPVAAPSPPSLPAYLDTRQVSELLGIPVKTLEYHRAKNKGLPYTRVEGAVRYSRVDVENYLAAATVIPGAPWVLRRS